MDNIHYDKIADKLIQFRMKIPMQAELMTRIGKNAAWELRSKIDDLLWQIDNYAECDNKGLIK